MHVASVQIVLSSVKFFTEGFENLPSSFFFNSENHLSSIEQCTWLHLYFLFEKFHLKIHNKMADNKGTDLPHETGFDISKDCFCYIDIFILWFEDYQYCCINSLDYYLQQATTKAAGSEFYSRWCYVRSVVGVSARRIGLAKKCQKYNSTARHLWNSYISILTNLLRTP